MCGRTACTLAPDEIRRACRQRNGNGAWTKPQWRNPPGGQQYYPSYNLAPSAHSPVLISAKHASGNSPSVVGKSSYIIQPMQWGLVPRWHQGTDAASFGYKMNNARSDGMMSKASFKKPLESGQRCVILADGYFEWKDIAKGKKQPYFIYFPQDTSTKNDKSTEKDTSAEIDSVQNTRVINEVLENFPICHDPKNHPNVDQEFCKEGFDTIKKSVDPVKEGVVDPITEVVDPINCEKEDKKEDKPRTTDVSSDDMNDTEPWNGRKLLTMAGLFDIWKPQESADPLYSYSVITVDSHPSLSWIHERMPAILNGEKEIQRWLDCSSTIEEVVSLIRPTDTVTCHPVSSLVNNSRNKQPNCVVPIDITKEDKTVKLSAESSFMKSWLTPAKRKASDEAKVSYTTEKKSKIE